jgi:serine/threonine protein kinase
MEAGKQTFYLGRYNCVEQLGTGALGDTFRAKIYGVAGFEKQYAVKRLHARLAADEEFMAGFVKAASAFAALDHPRIARVHEVNSQDNVVYVVIDLVRGVDLGQFLELAQKRGEKLSEDAIITLAVDIADALAYCHGRTTILPGGVFHLALRPTSVILSNEGVAKLADVGLIAPLIGRGKGEAALQAALPYIAPELWLGDPPDARADVFSLGAILRTVGEGIVGSDSQLHPIIARATEVERTKRQASMSELHDELQALVRDRVTQARTELAALARRLGLPRRTGPMSVTLPPTAAAGVLEARPWAPPTKTTPAGPPPIPEKAMPLSDDAIPFIDPDVDPDEVETRPYTRAEADELAFHAKNGTLDPPQDPSWSPPPLHPTPVSPVPLAFAAPTQDTLSPVEALRASLPAAKLPAQAARRSRRVIVVSALLTTAAALAVIFAAVRPGTPEPGATTVESAPPPKPPVAPTEEPKVAEAYGPAPEAKAPGGPAPAPEAKAVPEAPKAAPEAPKAAPEAPKAAPEAKAAPSAAAGSTGNFEIVTNPAGAALYVDGEAVGTSPARAALGRGTHKLVAAAEGYKLMKRDIDASAGKVELVLEPAKMPAAIVGSAGLKVRCHTQGELRIFVDDADTGKSCPNEQRVSVTPGEHKVGLYSPRTGELHEAEHEIEDSDYSTRVYVKY